MVHKKYNKLVRDKIPSIIEENGDTCNCHTADNIEYWQKLKEKLQEEVVEFVESEDISEIADILEVLDAIIEHKNFGKEELVKIKKAKLDKRGGFKNKIILDETN